MFMCNENGIKVLVLPMQYCNMLEHFNPSCLRKLVAGYEKSVSNVNEMKVPEP